jgi:hypothetical protein
MTEQLNGEMIWPASTPRANLLGAGARAGARTLKTEDRINHVTLLLLTNAVWLNMKAANRSTAISPNNNDAGYY